jgi:dephospho-CoA kinase
VATFTVALTGGVASGKSAVAERFASRGAAVFDADAAARDVVAHGTPGLGEIVARFGAGALDANGGLDRKAMRRRIFEDAAARAALEAIVHPRVRALLRECVEDAAAPYAVIAIPLLVENRDAYAWVDRVLVVDVPTELQRARLMARDGITLELADAMLAAQSTREQRLAIADDVIPNTGTFGDLDRAVGALHARYLGLAARTRPR